jgi:PAS domain-containing protein
MIQTSNHFSFDVTLSQTPCVNHSRFLFIDGYNVQSQVDRKKREVQEILYLDVLNDTNPVVIYKEGAPFFWNPAMEEITGYTFSEIQTLQGQGADIMELLYGWSQEELGRVLQSVIEGHQKKEGYDERVFTLRTKQ